jgi:hypothetical protein
MMLVEGDTVEAHALELDPSIEMFGIGADRDLGLKIFLLQGIRQHAAGDAQMIEMLGIG